MATPERVLISAKVASSASELVFNGASKFTSTYDEFELSYSNFVTADDSKWFYLVWSDDDGVSYLSGSVYRMINGHYDDVASHTNLLNDAYTLVGTTRDVLNKRLGNASGENCSGVLRFFCPTSATKMLNCIGKTAVVNQVTNTDFGIVGTGTVGVEQIDAIKILAGGGGLFSGNFELYGLN